MKTESGMFLKTINYTPDENYRRYLVQRYNALISLMKFKENEKILDAGCGDGAVIKLILDKKVKNIHIIAIDNSEESLNGARKNFSNYDKIVKILKANILALPFSDNYFDKTICFHVIEHLPSGKFTKALKELARVTKKELFLGFPNKYSLLKIWEILSQEGVREIINKVICFIRRNQPLVIENPKYSESYHIYYSTSYIKKILKVLGFYPQVIKKIYFPFKFFDISQKGLSVPFGHSVIIKSIKNEKDEIL
jgi:ubiquinone/menaquinone biosynthesis C-methylase UbiE